MRSHQWNALGLTVAIACVLSCGVMFPGTVVAGNNKVAICHFQPGVDDWVLLTVERTSAHAHLEWHDDAQPGGTTSQTGTVMGKDCEKQRTGEPAEGGYEVFPDIIEGIIDGAVGREVTIFTINDPRTSQWRTFKKEVTACEWIRGDGCYGQSEVER